MTVQSFNATGTRSALHPHPGQMAPVMTERALTFLRTLDQSPDASFNIECYTDVPSGGVKPQPDPLVRRFPNKTLAEVRKLIPELEVANAKGAGIFVAVNEFDGQRKKENLKRVRCIHGDFDGVAPGQVATIKSKLVPSIIVQSSTPDRLQMYWLLADGETVDAVTAEAINRRLVEYGADAAAVDVARLLRLPGFRHMKYRATGATPMVKVLEVCHA